MTPFSTGDALQDCLERRYVIAIVKTGHNDGHLEGMLPLGLYRALALVVEADSPQEALQQAIDLLAEHPEYSERGHVRVTVVCQSEWYSERLSNDHAPVVAHALYRVGSLGDTHLNGNGHRTLQQ